MEQPLCTNNHRHGRGVTSLLSSRGPGFDPRSGQFSWLRFLPGSFHNRRGNNMQKNSHIASNPYSPLNKLCENNNMGTNVSVHFKELNDMYINLMAV